jgi:hypothetical protein
MLVTLAACKGADGAIGPAGPQGAKGDPGIAGPTGPQGPPGTTKITIVKQVPSGGGQINSGALPAAVGSDPSKPPAVSCYAAEFQTGPWVAIEDGNGTSTSIYCWLVFQNGAWVAVIQNMPGLWWVAWVIVY